MVAASVRVALTDRIGAVEDWAVALTQTLLYAAESDITIERVRDLMKQVGPETPSTRHR